MRALPCRRVVRDPFVDRPLRGALWAIALIVATAVPLATGGPVRATQSASNGWTTSARVHRPRVAPGQWETTTVTLTSTVARAGLLYVEFNDGTAARTFSDGDAPAPTYWDNLHFAAGATTIYTFSRKVPLDAQPATYVVRIGIFDPHFAGLQHWNDTAATFDVVGADNDESPPTTTPLPSTGTGTGACGLAAAVFCATFDHAVNGGTRTGDLDPTLWGVSRVGLTNPGQGELNDIANASMTGCASSASAFTPSDVRICSGQLFETVNDGGGVANLDIYPKQPFDFAGRTGTVTFDVSADSDGTHGAWPEFVITDKPVPGVRGMISGQIPAGAANSIGFALSGGCGIAGMTGVGQMFATRNNVYSEPAFTTPNCITKGSARAMNHFEVRLSQNRLEVWGTDAGSSTLRQLAVADNLGLSMTKGLIWINDVHYNARKAIEPCECGTQYNHTFVWDNVGFDGPKTYRDLGFDVADANVPGGTPFAGDPTRRVGYLVGTGPITLNVTGVHRDQTPTGALLVLNTYSFAAVVPSVSINGGPWIDTPWPFDPQTYSWRSLAIPIPLEQVHDGANTITLKSADSSTIVANLSIILVAASPVP